MADTITMDEFVRRLEELGLDVDAFMDTEVKKLAAEEKAIFIAYYKPDGVAVFNHSFIFFVCLDCIVVGCYFTSQIF